MSVRERGQTSLLIVGFVVVVMMLIGAVVDASAAFLRKQSLDAVADGAALAAADGVAGRQVYDGGLGPLARIDPAAARAAIERYLRDSGALQEYPSLGYQLSTDQTSVTVRLVTKLTLPIPAPGIADTASVTSTASAVVPVS
jgi:Putative Flp pilus-assembly TadE/G-like